MTATPCCSSHFPAPPPPLSWLGCGLALLLWACSGATAAQGSTQRAQERVPNDRATFTYGVRPLQGHADVGSVAALSMGLRFRVTDEHALFADAYRARSPLAGTADVGYATRVGVEWLPAKSTLGLEHGALGMQLDSSYRVSLKLRRGGPSLYLRSPF